MSEAKRPTVIFWPSRAQLSWHSPLVFDRPPGLQLIRANQFQIDTLLNPDQQQLDRRATTSSGPVYACFSPERIDTVVRDCGWLTQQGIEVIAVNGAFVTQQHIAAFSSLWRGNSLAGLWQDTNFQAEPFASHPQVACRALGRDGGYARLQVVFSEAPDPSSLSLEHLFTLLPSEVGLPNSAAIELPENAGPVMAYHCGGDPQKFIARVVNSASVKAVASRCKAGLPLALLGNDVAVYTWFEADDLVKSQTAEAVACGVAYVPIGHPDLDIPATVAHIMHLRDRGYRAIVPRYWMPTPGSSSWHRLGAEYGFRNSQATALDGSDIVFDLPALNGVEGPELVAALQKDNIWPTFEQDDQPAQRVSLRNVHRMIKLYTAGIEADQHAAELLDLAVEALPQPASQRQLEPSEAYPFVSLNGEDPRVMLDQFMSERLQSMQALAPPVYAPIQHVIRSGGKRLRGILSLVLWAAAELPERGAIRVAVALEWIHAASLIQDDLPAMDNERTRRGEATTHRKHGEAAALLASDALVMLAFEELGELEAELGAGPTLKIINKTTRAIGREGLTAGQSFDLELAKRALVTTDDLLMVHSKKTAPLFALIGSCLGIAAGYSEEQLQELEEALTGLGIAFQIVDDLIDEQGGKNRVGSSDSRNQKPSFSTIMSNESAMMLATRYLQPLRDIVESKPQLRPLSRLLDFVTERRS